jgi:hypothetical protein
MIFRDQNIALNICHIKHKEPKNKNIHNTFELNAMKGKYTHMVVIKDQG